MSIDFAQMAADANSASPVSELERVRVLAELQIQQAARVAELELELKLAKELLARTEREDLPELMTELGLKKFTLMDGSEIEIKPDVACGIPKALYGRAIKWLKDHDFGGLVKHQVVVNFGREEEEAAQALTDHILDEAIGSPEVKEFVHPATLKAFIKERLELGLSPPADLFGIHPFNVAKINKGK